MFFVGILAFIGLTFILFFILVWLFPSSPKSDNVTVVYRPEVVAFITSIVESPCGSSSVSIARVINCNHKKDAFNYSPI